MVIIHFIHSPLSAFFLSLFILFKHEIRAGARHEWKAHTESAVNEYLWASK